MALKFFQILQLMIDTFLTKLTQFDKTGSVSKFITLLGYLKIKFLHRK